MKVLIILGGFFPGKKFGGPPVSVDNFCSLMKDSCDVYLYTHNHDLGEKEAYATVESNVWIDRGNCKVKYVPDEQYNRAGFEKVIEEINPDVLYLQGLFQSCVLPCLAIAKKKNLKVVLAPRGELCSGALAIRKYKKIPYIYFLRLAGLVKNIHFQSTSDEETEAIHTLLKVPYERIHFLTNIPSIPAKEYARQPKVAGKRKFIFLSRIHPKKNLLSAIRYFEKVKGEAQFDIYGPMEDEAYWKECKESISKLPDNVKVNYCGLVSHDEVHETFSKYDAFLFPTLSENYGHVIAESLVVGTPVIISDQTPWTDVNDAGAGFAYSLADAEAFEKAIQRIIDTEGNEIQANIKVYIESKLKLEELKRAYAAIFA